jgi:hypothetical protein
MRRSLASFFVVFFAFGDCAFAQKNKAPAVPAPSPVAAQVPSGPPPPNTLQDGTAIKLRLAGNLTSATAKAGQQVSFEAVEETDVQGVMVIPKGAQALATITSAEPRRSMGRAGKLDVNIDSVRLADGEKAALSATQNTCLENLFHMIFRR